jgi:hypothetical protein
MVIVTFIEVHVYGLLGLAISVWSDLEIKRHFGSTFHCWYISSKERDFLHCNLWLGFLLKK